MDKDSKIYVAGHRGMVGSAVVRALRSDGFDHLVVRTRQELDLTDQAAVRDFFATEKPDAVVLASARVGGIHANNTYPADFISESAFCFLGAPAFIPKRLISQYGRIHCLRVRLKRPMKRTQWPK